MENIIVFFSFGIANWQKDEEEDDYPLCGNGTGAG